MKVKRILGQIEVNCVNLKELRMCFCNADMLSLYHKNEGECI